MLHTTYYLHFRYYIQSLQNLALAWTQLQAHLKVISKSFPFKRLLFEWKYRSESEPQINVRCFDILNIHHRPISSDFLSAKFFPEIASEILSSINLFLLAEKIMEQDSMIQEDILFFQFRHRPFHASQSTIDMIGQILPLDSYLLYIYR